MIFGKRHKYRIFDYEPRFYKPEEDEDERRKRKLKFRTARKIRRRTKSPVFWIIL